MNLKRNLSVIGLALLFVPLVALACSLPFASAPSPTETPTAVPLPTAMNQAAAPSEAACLIGAWDVGDLGPYLKAAIPPDALQGGQLEPKGYSGSLIYHFAPDGKVTAVADQYQLNAQVKLAILSLPLKVTINGTTSASYTADPQNETLSLFNPDVSQLTASVTLAGNEVVKPDQILPYVWFGSSATTAVVLGYTCDASTLSTFIIDTTGNRTPLFALKRVAQ
jgi:hypothetical protein